MLVELQAFSGKPLFVEPSEVVALCASIADGCTALYLREVRDPLTVRGEPQDVRAKLDGK